MSLPPPEVGLPIPCPSRMEDHPVIHPRIGRVMDTNLVTYPPRRSQAIISSVLQSAADAADQNPNDTTLSDSEQSTDPAPAHPTVRFANSAPPSSAAPSIVDFTYPPFPSGSRDLIDRPIGASSSKLSTLMGWETDLVEKVKVS